ncbi:MAG: cation diffusion facilitator family transporter [Parvibaculaceae bacterium]
MTASSGSNRAIYAALVGNLLIAISKFVAAGLTGSSAMLSEAVHSLVDTSNEVLLLYGIRRAAKPPDRTHPLGHGRELYFWSFIVAVLIFALGAGVSLYEGITHILAPEPIENFGVTYAVLALSALFEFYSWSIALKEVRRRKGRLGYLDAARRSKDLTTYTVLFEDSAALLGIGIAFLGIGLSQWLEIPALDGVASVGIALVLGMAATFLARESKGLLIGEPASRHVEEAILRLAGEDPAVHHPNGILTVHLAPDQIVASLSAEFHDSTTAPEIEACVERIEAAIKARHPDVTVLFVKPQSAARWRALQRLWSRPTG